jgi:hypothetical protein
MPIGFAIFITAVIVSVVVILIYHFVIIGTNNDGGSGGGGYGYNYDANIAYLNTLTEALAVPFKADLNTQLNYNNGDNFPELPGGSGTFRDNLSKP